MSSGFKKNKSGLVVLYQANLEQRLQQGDRNLVCRDEDLCKEVGDLLSNGAAQDTLCPLGLDPLSVMEASLQKLPSAPGRTGLESLAKAFEVLELAALNLYLCPWRKEYRVVKVFSGMFTHCVKPALTSQQANELFGLLGYQPTGPGEQEELRLSSKPVHADCLLQLACAFFTARVECQLLLSSLAPMCSRAEWELQLVQERKRGHSLQIAWDSAKRKLESIPQSSEHDTSGDLDLYTDDHQEPGEKTGTNHMTAPPKCSYSPPKESSLTFRMSHSNTTVPKRENEESTRKVQTVCVTNKTCQTNPKSYLTSTSKADCEKQVTPGVGAQSNSEEPGRDLRQVPQDRMDVPVQSMQTKIIQGREQAQKDLMKHSCMNKSTSDIFCVCYNCHDIHDFACNALKTCELLNHHLQETGRLQPPQREQGPPTPPQRHTCLKAEDTPYVVCYTCNKSHDCLCTEAQKCKKIHDVKYLVEMNKEETHVPSKPMHLHKCTNATQPNFVCLTCRVFHTAHCDVQCFGKHDVQNLNPVCSRCSYTEVHVLCRYCCAQYCKKCWFKDPIDCKCGMPFPCVTSV